METKLRIEELIELMKKVDEKGGYILVGVRNEDRGMIGAAHIHKCEKSKVAFTAMKSMEASALDFLFAEAKYGKSSRVIILAKEKTD